jgi:uncharacterized protein (TIGR03435 family)
MKRRTPGLLVFVWLLCAHLNAQAPSFEVASVKVNKTNQPQSLPPMQPGRVTLISRTLRDLIQFAYSTIESPLHELQIAGGPEWVSRDRFDVDAKMEFAKSGPEGANLVRQMMRKLLEERFQLIVRNDKRQLPVYELVVARADGRLGPGLRRRPSSDCAGKISRGGPPPDPNGTTPLCGYLSGLRGNITFRGVPISALTRPGALTSDRIVIDQTKLTGFFDIDLVSAVETGAANQTDAPSVFTALQEQLGLRLETARAPIDVLVIERAERPIPD